MSETSMTYLLLLLVGSITASICKLIFALVALRGVPKGQRVEAIRAIGDAWRGWGLTLKRSPEDDPGGPPTTA
ncbi:hypothetical protein [Pimelobacter sp. 30-1]|uniref:hypothetical protein n=1 Tax=Pimelobacter sp. 30-1 TaxID=2004991 RepID=UPI001C04EE75|nr:hypothetical protein [Pimelobacter sp. 30-1]